MGRMLAAVELKDILRDETIVSIRLGLNIYMHHVFQNYTSMEVILQPRDIISGPSLSSPVESPY